MKRSDTLGFKIGVIFVIFVMIILVLCGLTTYYSQMQIYKAQCEDNIRSVGDFLAAQMAANGEEFIRYQNYYISHHTDVNIPVDADEFVSYRDRYQELFTQNYPGRTLGEDLSFDDLDEEVKNAYLIYRHLYWLLTFERARVDFKLPYSYYLLMDEEKHNATYMIDGERNSRADHLEFIKANPQYRELHHEQGDEAEFMYLGDEYHNDRDKFAVEWETWETGEKSKGYQIWQNNWGDTYAYYTPLIINGQKLGLIGAEVEIRTVNTEILRNTVRQFIFIILIMAAGAIILMIMINRRYISKIVRLEASVRDYTITKDPAVVDQIRRDIRGKDEITSLSEGIINLILEIQDHIRSLTHTYKELDEANSNAARMNDLAHKDSLTGIRNNTAYEQEMKVLQAELEKGRTEFGIAMIDLNDLKVINDTCGHDKGNLAIQKLSNLICQVFKHSKVFRIGGDEFTVILENEDFKNRKARVGAFKYQISVWQEDPNLPPWEKISAAIGMAVYDSRTDADAESVFKRADELMYENKKEMKAGR